MRTFLLVVVLSMLVLAGAWAAGSLPLRWVEEEQVATVPGVDVVFMALDCQKTWRCNPQVVDLRKQMALSAVHFFVHGKALVEAKVVCGADEFVLFKGAYSDGAVEQANAGNLFLAGCNQDKPPTTGLLTVTMFQGEGGSKKVVFTRQIVLRLR